MRLLPTPATPVLSSKMSPAGTAAVAAPPKVTIFDTVLVVKVCGNEVGVPLQRAPSVGTPSALAEVAAARGRGAPTPTAPAARAFTKPRRISRKVFIKNPSLVVFIFIHSIC